MTAVGIDVGGTHTDIVLVGDDGALRWADKVPSTPSAPIEAIRRALATVPQDEPVDVCVNGTTIGINALLQGRLPRIGLAATRGFPDLLYIRRETKENIYDLDWRKPLPLVPRHLTFEIEERLDVNGDVLVPLTDVGPLVEWIERQGLEDLAVCLLHAYRNPAHEERLREEVLRRLPELRITLSSEVWPEWREFERTYNTALNAALKPVVEAYLHDLVRAVREEIGHARVHLMHADGGILEPREIARRPVLTLLSGTVAGALMGARVAAAAGFDHAVSLDMGGTSTDLSLAEFGRPRRSAELSIEWEGTLGFAGVDVVSIGAGGGSIVWVDEAGGMHVGPASAGADPGPAALRAGGSEPTLTDAYLLLGYLGPEPTIGGRRLDRDAARRAFAPLVEATGLQAQRLYEGAYEIATASLVAGIKRTTIERGVDPRSCALVCFGGAGPLHAAGLVRELDLAAAVVPPRPGNGSALGLLLAPMKHSVSQTYFAPLDRLSAHDFRGVVDQVEARASAALPQDEGPIETEWYLSLRYRGQTRDLALPVSVEHVHELDETRRSEIAAAFHGRHREEYTFASETEPVELVNVRCDASLAHGGPGERFGALELGRTNPMEQTEVDGTSVLSRDSIRPGEQLAGPAIILDVGSTVLLPAGAQARVDSLGNLLIDRNAK